VLSLPHFTRRAQVNLAALENRVKKDKKQNRKTSAVEAKLKAVKGVQAANLLAAREQISDAYWDPGQRAKVRSGIGRSLHTPPHLSCSTQIGGFLLRAVLETASVKVPGQARHFSSVGLSGLLTRPQAPGTFDVKPAFELTYVFDPKAERRHGAVKWHHRVAEVRPMPALPSALSV